MFKPEETYYLFLLFAKATTSDTLIYMAKETSFDDTKDVWMTQADVRPVPISFTDLKTQNPPADPDHPLLPAKWKAKYTKSTGLLQVDIDLADFEQKFSDGGEDACRPFSYCSWDAGTRKCNDRQVPLHAQRRTSLRL